MNNVAIPCRYRAGKINLYAMVFADPGSEMLETYESIESIVKPFCKNISLPFFTVGSPTLYGDHWENKIIPQDVQVVNGQVQDTAHLEVLR